MPRADEALFAQFARMGLTRERFDESKLSPDMRRGLVRALADGPAVAISSFASTATVRNGWNWVTGLDSFGFNYPLRAMVAGPYLGGNGEREAMYPIRYTDADGQVLNGKNKYVVKLEKEPPGQLSKSKTLSSVTAWTSAQLVDHPERKSGRNRVPTGGPRSDVPPTSRLSSAFFSPAGQA